MRRWFREHYRLPPTDERYLKMTDEAIYQDYEEHLAINGEALKTCPFCKTETFQKHCPTCRADGRKVALSGDLEIDRAKALVDSGEEVDLNDFFKSGTVDDDDFVEVEKEA